ncbi:MAG TPA: hypothetical protein VIM94_05360 [Salegentibacter sp.]|uniref:hypothetical protein n=1 Tax=Salegentibacter sp. TaxID=1903072 RepID=UPI002F93FCB8
MKTIKLSFFHFLGIFAALQLALSLDFQVPPILRFYLADFLCMPIVLAICLFCVQFIKKDRNLRLPAFSIFSLFVLYSIYFEVILPPLHERYTSDPVDVLMYLSGSLLFYFLQKIS